MGGRGSTSTRNSIYDRSKDIEAKIFKKLPKYAQDAVIALDSYNPRSYGYNEPINYHLYYVDKNGVINFLSEDGSDFLAEVRGLKNDFGRYEDWNYQGDYSEGQQLHRRK